MKVPVSISIFTLLILLAACSVPGGPADTNPTLTTSAELLAKATDDLSVREYLAKELAKDESDQPELDQETVHSDEFYAALARGLEAQGEANALERVQSAFNASPHAYLVASDKVSTWTVATQSPLIAHFYEDAELTDTVSALDSELSSHTVTTEQKPDRFVLVLNEGVPEQLEQEASLVGQAARFVCNDENHNKTYTRAFKIIDSKAKGAGGTVVQQADFVRGWVLEDVEIDIRQSRGGWADLSKVNAGSHFVSIEELKFVRDDSIKYAVELGLGKEIKGKVDTAIASKYETFIKYTTNKVNETTASVNWGTDNRFRLWGQRLRVNMIMTERCNSEAATTVPKTTKAFRDEITRVAYGVEVTGKANFYISPSHIQAGLSIKGNGVTKRAFHGSSLDLEPGTYTLTGNGYDTGAGQEYTAPTQRFTVTANKTTNVTVYMRPINR